MPSYRVITFGCRVNQADSLALERDLRARGWQSGDEGAARVVVINTCSVTGTADQGAKQAIRRVAREHPGARVVVTGCFATRCAAEAATLPGVAAVVPNGQKATLADAVVAVAPATSHRSTEGDGPCGASVEPGVAGRTAWTLRVQTGCEQACAYCVIPRTRGPSRSRTLQEITAEIGSVARAGFREIAITGVHLGSWGRDLVPRVALEHLLDALAAGPSDVLFRISSLEPMDCTPAVRARLLTSPRFAPHFHLPLQHASDRLLRAMRRPYSLAHYADLVADIRSARSDAWIGSDVLVGFPGEIEADHVSNLEWLAQSGLAQLHVFPYSDRPGTEASTMPAKTHGAVIRARAAEVRAVARDLSSAFRARMAGTVRPGLTLEDGTLVVTDNYLKVRIPPGLPRNVRVRVRIDAAGDPATGTIVSP